MLLGILAVSLLGNALKGRGVTRADEGKIRTGQNFECCLIVLLILKYKTIIKTNLNLVVLIQEKNCLKQEMEHI